VSWIFELEAPASELLMEALTSAQLSNSPLRFSCCYCRLLQARRTLNKALRGNSHTSFLTVELIARTVNSTKLQRAGHTDGMRRKGIHIESSWESLESVCLEEPEGDGRMILKRILWRQLVRVRNAWNVVNTISSV
jgi:hypothetical protein